MTNYRNATFSHKYLSHGTIVELIWTITPTIILLLVAFYSFRLLYLIDYDYDPAITVGVEAHQ
jgi:heme/copper-type cytochrome/quinol oxidase subunit 2